jgi:hypothetical protein
MQQITGHTMKHFIYKTTHKNGKYYVGRHSTDNLEDGYIGSGHWPLSIKDKSSVTREILEYAMNENHLVELERKYLAEHFGKHNCMNRTSDPVGFSSENNPMKNSEFAAKISGENHWSRKDPDMFREKIGGMNHWMNKNIEAKQNFLESHPNKDGRNAKLAYQRGRHNTLSNNPSVINSKNGTHHWQNGNSPNYGGKLNKQLVENGTHNWLGPEANQKRIDAGTHNFLGSASNLKMLAEGRHPSQQKKTCEHCGKTISSSMYKRWHGDNCKSKRKENENQ